MPPSDSGKCGEKKGTPTEKLRILLVTGILGGGHTQSIFMTGQPPPCRTPPTNMAVLRAYSPLVSLNKAL